MYDFICDPTILSNLLQNNLNLFLRKNIVSLKNCFEIKDGTLIKYLFSVYNFGLAHIKNCEVDIFFCNFKQYFRSATKKEVNVIFAIQNKKYIFFK